MRAFSKLFHSSLLGASPGHKLKPHSLHLYSTRVSINEALQKCSNMFKMKPGIAGFGAGKTDDGKYVQVNCALVTPHRDAIVVFLETYAVLLPSELDGFPVLPKFSGMFEALSSTVMPNTFSLGHIKQVLVANQHKLTLLPGICAYGIGLAPNDPNHLCIIVYVEKEENMDGIPTSIDRVLVDTRVSGKFEALHSQIPLVEGGGRCITVDAENFFDQKLSLGCVVQDKNKTKYYLTAGHAGIYSVYKTNRYFDFIN